MPNDHDMIRPWTEELIPAVPEDATQRQLLEYIACAMRRQLQVLIPEGARLDENGDLVLPDSD